MYACMYECSEQDRKIEATSTTTTWNIEGKHYKTTVTPTNNSISFIDGKNNNDDDDIKQRVKQKGKECSMPTSKPLSEPTKKKGL